MAGRQTFECESSNQLASVTCSFDGEPEESCSLPLEVGIGRFGTEEHAVAVTFTNVYEQTVILTFDFQLIERSFTDTSLDGNVVSLA